MFKKFEESERNELLKVKGVGPTVVSRLEEIGISSFDQLREWDARELTSAIAELFGSTCWKNSPQARDAIKGAIEKAHGE